MTDDDRFRIHRQLVTKVCAAFGVPGNPTLDEALAWIVAHYAPVGAPDDGPPIPAVEAVAHGPIDGFGVERRLVGEWQWAVDRAIGMCVLQHQPRGIVRLVQNQLEVYGVASIPLANLLSLLAVYLGDFKPSTLQRVGLVGYPNDPDPQPTGVRSWELPIWWWFPYRFTTWHVAQWSSSTRNGGWWGYTWTRLDRGRSQWARLTIWIFYRRSYAWKCPSCDYTCRFDSDRQHLQCPGCTAYLVRDS